MTKSIRNRLGRENPSQESKGSRIRARKGFVIVDPLNFFLSVSGKIDSPILCCAQKMKPRVMKADISQFIYAYNDQYKEVVSFFSHMLCDGAMELFLTTQQTSSLPQRLYLH